MEGSMSPEESPQRAVIRQLIEGRHVQESFHALFRHYYPAVSGFFARRGFSTEDCRDLTQEVFAAVYTGIQSLRAEEAFHGWLFAIARHVGARHLEKLRGSKQAVAASGGGSEIDVASPAPDPLHAMLDQEKTDLMRAALAGLPERMRECVRARVVDGLNYRQIGELMGISENTVAVQMHRAMKTIRARLKALFGEEEL
jgi:RNA polymerase sigma factor (sigma-70 family)